MLLFHLEIEVLAYFDKKSPFISLCDCWYPIRDLGLRYPVEVRAKRRSDVHARRVELREATFVHLLEALKAKLGDDLEAKRVQVSGGKGQLWTSLVYCSVCLSFREANFRQSIRVQPRLSVLPNKIRDPGKSYHHSDSEVSHVADLKSSVHFGK